MRAELALTVLGTVMGWNDEVAEHEFAWLRLMARFKYDSYRDFHAGMRFIESLATWLQQFDVADRQIAYDFVRHSLVYIGPLELERLVEQFYPRHVTHRILRTAAAENHIPVHRVFADATARATVDRLRRQTLFLGLSGGARTDALRRANAGLLTNEQIVESTQPDAEKWRDLLDNLRRDLNDTTARFRLVYLIDDFVGTGTSFLRAGPSPSVWKGKLSRFRDSFEAATTALDGDALFDARWALCVHYYIASSAGAAAIEDSLSHAGALFSSAPPSATHFSYGLLLPETLPIRASDQRHADFVRLTNKYYDPEIETRHSAVGGVTHLGLGYGACGLPLVLEHNTPNNAVALLWAETGGGYAWFSHGSSNATSVSASATA